MGPLSDLWLVPLGVGAGGALALVLAIRKLNTGVSQLRDSMRPLRVNSRRGANTRAATDSGRKAGSRTL